MTQTRAARKKTVQKDNTTGHALPDLAFEQPSTDNLQAVCETLKRNLETIPMRNWEEPILQALRSAYILGQATSVIDGEDHALNNSPAEEDSGFEFINAMSSHFDGVAAGLGISAKDVQFVWRTITVAPGVNAVALFPCLPMGVAKSLLSS